MADEEPFGAEGDVADAIGEIANMIAGATKTPANGSAPDIVLGLLPVSEGRSRRRSRKVATERSSVRCARG
jgi:CheY-specific phosphatase CheX